MGDMNAKVGTDNTGEEDKQTTMESGSRDFVVLTS